MKIGIIVLSVGSFGTKGFYNLQEVGLAKALDAYGNKVQVYKPVPKSEKETTERIDGTKNGLISYLPSKQIGSNGVPDLAKLDTRLDALICFSDTQIMLPNVFRWAQKYKIPFFPYIGVVESHSNHWVKKTLIDFLFRRNVAVYKKCHCLAKTVSVRDYLKTRNVSHTTVVPVGLDTDLLHDQNEAVCAADLKRKHGYQEADKIILFIGRLIDEKQPVRMIELFSEIVKKDASYRLLMVGKGELKEAVEERIAKYKLQDRVKTMASIPNSEIWELYQLADAFVNLNQQEIFGMAILEAMYYGCKVVAWRAPGPDMIIENGRSGWLAESEEEIIQKVLENKPLGTEAHQRVVHAFTWEGSAKKILSVIGESHENFNSIYLP